MRCEKCEGAMWDNREDKKNPNSPDFKCKDKDCGHAVWLTEKGDPSRKGKAKPGKGGPKPSSDREQYWADKAIIDRVETRILRRQSAQDKALKWVMAQAEIAKVNGHKVEDLTPDYIRKLIEWFLNDAVRAGADADIDAAKHTPEPLPVTEEEANAELQTEESLEI